MDIVSLAWQAATNEIGGTDFISRGDPDKFLDFAAAPHAVSETGDVAQKYTSFFWTHHSTDATTLPDANRLRAIADFFNRSDIAGALDDGKSDRFEVRSFIVERITLPVGYSPPEETPSS